MSFLQNYAPDLEQAVLSLIGLYAGFNGTGAGCHTKLHFVIMPDRSLGHIEVHMTMNLEIVRRSYIHYSLRWPGFQMVLQESHWVWCVTNQDGEPWSTDSRLQFEQVLRELSPLAVKSAIRDLLS